MPVLHPSVDSPLSPCSVRVRVTGAFPGAIIDVYADDRQVVTGRTAVTTEEVYDLDPGEELHANEVIWAAQTVDGERSSDELAREHGLLVMAAPSGARGMGGLTWRSHLYVCGQCIRLTGAIPGAVVTVRDSLGNDLCIGTGITEAVTTRVTAWLNRPISRGETLVAEYQVCGEDGPPTESPTHSPTPDDPVEIPTPLPDPLRRPRILDPLLACGRRVPMGNAYEGALVTVSRTAVGDRSLCATRPDPRLDYDSEANQLEEGETVTVRQGFPDCQPPPTETESTRVVGPPNGLPEPEVDMPLCAGSSYLLVHGLVPYATVRIYNNGEELGRICADGTSQTIEIPPLASGTVTVTQELCSVLRHSREVEVVGCESRDIRPPTPQLATPYECASVVYVFNVRRGIRVRVFSNISGCIGDAVAQGPGVLIPVPTLSGVYSHFLRPVAYYPGEEVSGHQQPVRILHLGADGLTPEIRTTPLTGDRSVEVEYILPGSVVEVYVDGELWGSTQTKGLIGTDHSVGEERVIVQVALLAALSDNHSIQVRQRFCERVSRVSDPISPAHCRGRIQVGLKSLDPSLEWWNQLETHVDWMRRFFRYFGFDVTVIHKEILDLPHLRNLMSRGSEFDELVGFRNGLTEQDIAVYLVHTFEDDDAPGLTRRDHPYAIVERNIEGWVAAHEVGHSLGLVDDDRAHSSRLMHPGGRTPGIHDSPSISDDRALTAAETDTMTASPFTYPC